jgi:hypothetical protein
MNEHPLWLNALEKMIVRFAGSDKAQPVGIMQSLVV